jgi:tRNA dimethylallyltransferase
LEKIEKKLIVIAGPTAVGKTAVSLDLARIFGAPIISADSRQIFSEMNIGTAKPSASELAEVKHYFINSRSISEGYDAATYGREALELIHHLFKTENILIMCGGSGLYIKAVCEGFDDIPDVPDTIRKELTENYSEHGISWLQRKMEELDADYLAKIDRQNPQRLMRALEIVIGTGKSISSFQIKNKLKHDFEIIKIALELPREILYHRIDERMDKMISDGLFREAESLYAHKNYNALQTVGYQEIFDFMDGKYDREEAIRLLKRNSRHYAKRQLTWFRRDAEMTWFDATAIDEIKNFIFQKMNINKSNKEVK